MVEPVEAAVPEQDWLEAEGRRLLAFARGARLDSGGFGWLDDRGRVVADRPLELWINSRMTYVFALAQLRGEPDAAAYADHGVAALRDLFWDGEHGGWPSQVGGPEPAAGTKAAYDHAFVLLAASAATLAGRPGAADLLDRAVDVVDRWFWDEAAGAVVDTWDRSWSDLEPYRGANANMHAVEAFLAAADATGDGHWRERAARIAARLVGEARARHGRMPEHYAPDWTPRPELNRDRPDHPFRPYGATIGHGLEWSRLLLHLRAAGGGGDELLADSGLLFHAAVRDGWSVDGAVGFVYTVDWDGTPVFRRRMHWVVAEATLAATALGRATGDPAYGAWADRWWGYAREHLLDPDGGSWRHELDEQNRPSASVWQGKPDVYHAYQACVLPSLPLHPGPAAALATRRS